MGSVDETRKSVIHEFTCETESSVEFPVNVHMRSSALFTSLCNELVRDRSGAPEISPSDGISVQGHDQEHESTGQLDDFSATVVAADESVRNRNRCSADQLTAGNMGDVCEMGSLNLGMGFITITLRQ